MSESVQKGKGGRKAGQAATTVRRKAAAKGADKSAEGGPDQWSLRLYVAGQTPRSIAALANLKAFCKEHLDDRYKIEVIDLLKEPWRARTDQIVAIPTLVRHAPVPIRKIIGDLSNKDRVLIGFDLRQRGESSSKIS